MNIRPHEISDTVNKYKRCRASTEPVICAASPLHTFFCFCNVMTDPVGGDSEVDLTQPVNHEEDEKAKWNKQNYRHSQNHLVTTHSFQFFTMVRS